MLKENFVTLTYTGDKPVKTDTITGSRLLFPRHKPVDTPAEIAWQLLAFPDCWIKHDDLKTHLAEEKAAGQLAQKQQKAQEIKDAEQAQADSFEVQTRNGVIDIGKYTTARLETLAESHDLNIQRDPQESAEAYRCRVRNAFKALERKKDKKA